MKSFQLLNTQTSTHKIFLAGFLFGAVGIPVSALGLGSVFFEALSKPFLIPFHFLFSLFPHAQLFINDLTNIISIPAFMLINGILYAGIFFVLSRVVVLFAKTRNALS